MQIGTAILLIAVGAIMRYAVNADTDGFDINTAGLILMIVGALGLVVSLLLATIWSGRRETRVVREPERY